MNFDGGKLQQFVTQKTMQFEPCFPPGNPQPNSPLSWGGVLEVRRGVSRGGVLGKCPGVVPWGGVLVWCPGMVSWGCPGACLGGCPGCPGMLSWPGVLGGVLGWAWGNVLGWCPGAVSWLVSWGGVLGWCPGVVSRRHERPTQFKDPIHFLRFFIFFIHTKFVVRRFHPDSGEQIG